MINVLIAYAPEQNEIADTVAALLADGGYTPLLLGDLLTLGASDPAGAAVEIDAVIKHVGVVVALHSFRSRWSDDFQRVVKRAKALGKHAAVALDDPEGVPAGADAAPPTDLSRLDRDPSQADGLLAAVETAIGKGDRATGEKAKAARLRAGTEALERWRPVAEADRVSDYTAYLRSDGGDPIFQSIARHRLIDLGVAPALDPPRGVSRRWVAAAAAIGFGAALGATSIWNSMAGDNGEVAAQALDAPAEAVAFAAAQTDISTLREEVEALRAALTQKADASLAGELTKAEARVAELGKTFAALSEDVSSVSSEMSGLRAENAETLANLAAARQGEPGVEAERIGALDARLSAMAAAQAELEAATAATADEMSALRSDIARLAARPQTTSDDAESVSVDLMAALSMRLDEMSELHAAQEQRLAAAQNERAELISEVASLQRMFEETQASEDDALTRARLDELSAKMANDIEALRDLQGAALASISAEVDGLGAALAGLSEQTERAASTTQLSDAKSRFDAEVARLTDRQVNILARLDEFGQFQDTATTSITGLYGAEGSYQEQVGELQRQVVELIDETNELQAALASAEAERSADEESYELALEALRQRLERTAESGDVASPGDRDAVELGEPSSELARRAQFLLDRLGYDLGVIDGKWGRRSTAAMREFQAAAGLETTGFPDRRSINALSRSDGAGLGGARVSVFFRDTPSSRDRADRVRRFVEDNGGQMVSFGPIVTICDRLALPDRTHLGFKPGFERQVDIVVDRLSLGNATSWEKRAGDADFFVAFCGD